MSFIGFFLLFLCLVMFLRCWQNDSRKSFIVTPFLFFMACEIVFVWPSTIYAQLTGISPDAYPLVVATTASFSFMFAFLIFGKALPYKSNIPDEFLKKDLGLKYPQTYYLVSIALFSLMLFAMGLYLYQGMPVLVKAIVGLIKGQSGSESAAMVSSGRKYITKAHYFGGSYRGQGLIRMFMRIGWPYLLSLSLLFYYKTRRFLWIVISCFLFLALFTFVAGDGTRSPFLWCIVYLVFLSSLILKLEVRSIAIFVVCLFFLLVGISFLSPKLQSTLGQDNIISVVSSKLAKRIFLGNGKYNVYIIEFIRSGELKHKNGEIGRAHV